MQKPFGGDGLPLAEKVCDYRISRARRTVENAFGIMASRFRILRKPIAFSAKNVEYVVRACVVLHNFLRSMDADGYTTPGMIDSENDCGDVQGASWRDDPPGDPFLTALEHRSRGSSEIGTAVRLRLRDFFMSEAGSLPWQISHVNRGRIQ